MSLEVKHPAFMQQMAQRRPATYGKKSLSGRLAEGMDSLIEKSSSDRSSTLQRPSQSPAKYRKLNSPVGKDLKVFEVPSSDEELSEETHDEASPPKLALSRYPFSQSTSDLYKEPEALEPQALTVWSSRKRHALAASPIPTNSERPQTPTKSTSSSKVSPDSHATTPELSQRQSDEAGNDARTFPSTPRQSQLWTKLLQEDTEAQDQIHELRIAETNQVTQRNFEDGSSSRRTRQSKLPKLVEKLRPSEDRGSPIANDSFDTFEPSPDSGSWEVLEQPSTPVVSATNIGSYSTYSHKRTCLEDETDYTHSLVQSTEEPKIISRHEDIHAIPSWDIEEEFGDADVGLGVKSIHELRAAGDAMRFDNEVNDLLEDIKTCGHNTLPDQRSGLIVLATRLESSTFRQRFINGSYQDRLFRNILRNNDKICATASAAALAFLLSDEAIAINASSQSLAEIPVATLSAALADNNTLVEIAKSGQLGLSQFAQKSLADFHGLLLNSALFAKRNATSLTPRDITLKSLEIFMRRMREVDGGQNLLTSNVLCQVIAIGKSNPKDLIKSPSNNFETILSILEKSAVSSSGVKEDSIWTPRDVHDTIPLLETAIKPDNSQKTSRQLALKLCLNLSNNCEYKSDALSSGDLTTMLLELVYTGLKAGQSTGNAKLGKADQKAVEQFDDLILSLGVMMNLAEMSSVARRAIEQNHRTLFDSIVQLFIENRRQHHESISMSSASLQIAFGYVSILLANLAQNSKLRARIVTKLPDGRIQSLVEAVEEFVGQHLEADRQSQDGQEWAAFTQRLQAVVISLKDVTHF